MWRFKLSKKTMECDRTFGGLFFIFIDSSKCGFRSNLDMFVNPVNYILKKRENVEEVLCRLCGNISALLGVKKEKNGYYDPMSSSLVKILSERLQKLPRQIFGQAD